MRIRKFEEKDAQACSKLKIKNLLEINSKDYDKDIINILIKDATPEKIIKNSKKKETFVAEENGKILGTGSLSGNELRTFFVDIEYQRKGIGKKLVQRVIQEAKKKKILDLFCLSVPIGEEFYAACGFKRVKEKLVDCNGYKRKVIEMTL